MRKLLLFPLIIICLSCNSPEYKAKNLIEQKLKESLHDWNSYEPVKLGSLDSAFLSIYDNSKYIGAINRYNSLKKEYERSESEFWIYKGESSWAKQGRQESIDNNFRILDSMKICSQLMIDIEKKFSPDFKGWKMQHSYRANNAGGNKVIGHYMYYFDKEITKIIDTEDIGEK